MRYNQIVTFVTGHIVNKGRIASPISRQRMSVAAIKRVEQHPKTVFQKCCTPWNKGLTKEVDTRVSKETHPCTQETRDRISKANKGRKLSQETKNRMSVSNDRQRHSEIMKEHWKEPGYAKRVLHRRIPSYPEQMFMDMCKGFRYVGNGKLTIDGKNPDFVNTDDDHKLIEIWGDYFHRGQNPQQLIDFYYFRGYDCLIIWASELKHQEQVLAKIQKFVEV